MNTYYYWLHQSLEKLPVYQYPYKKGDIPPNGIYFMYEKGELFGDSVNQQRIVRIGSHTGDGNLPARIANHFDPGERKMNFGPNRQKPSDRSIFRKNIGRVFLNQILDPYLDIWNIDFTEIKNRIENGHLRNIDKEHTLEKQITAWLRSRISFRFIIVDDNIERAKLEKHSISSVAYGNPSTGWLGKDSPIEKIRSSGLWQDQHIDGPGIDVFDEHSIENAVEKTAAWLRYRKI